MKSDNASLSLGAPSVVIVCRPDGRLCRLCGIKDTDMDIVIPTIPMKWRYLLSADGRNQGKAKFSGIDFSKVEFHTPATDDAILGKLVDLKCVDLKTLAEITGLGTKIADSALVAQSRCLEASAQFLAASAALLRCVAACGEGPDARDKLGIDEAKVKLVKDARAATAVLEAAIRPHGEELDSLFRGKTKRLHAPALDNIWNANPEATIKQLLASSRSMVKRLVDQWALDLKDLGDALGKFCPAWQGRDSELLTDKDLQKSLLTNPHYSKITPAVELM